MYLFADAVRFLARDQVSNVLASRRKLSRCKPSSSGLPYVSVSISKKAENETVAKKARKRERGRENFILSRENAYLVRDVTDQLVTFFFCVTLSASYKEN